MIIGIDHGYYAIKTKQVCFPTGLMRYTYEPYTMQNVLQYGGAYYVCGTGRQTLVKDKTANDNYYFLTLAALAQEIRKRKGERTAKVILAAGLPLAGFGAVLRVAQVGKIGAFLDWGLEKDLLLPYHEQTLKVREGEDVLVALYIDKSSRLCATMKVYHYLSTRTPYVVGDMVKGRVYEISDRFGVFVAVDDKYSALIPAREAKGKYRPGKILELRVSEVKEDGKMNVTDRQKAYLQINEDAENVLEVINEFAGVLPFDDKASPEVIQREFGLSKGAFKRAIGHLMKEGKVEIKDKRIYAK